jgi:hypothetical protein
MKKPKSNSRKRKLSTPEMKAKGDKIKRRLVPTLVILLLGVFTMQFLSSSLDPLRSEIDKTNKQSAMIQQQYTQGIAVMSNPEVTDAENTLAFKQMPSDAQLSDVIAQVDQLARKHNLIWTAGAPSSSPVIDQNLPTGIIAWSMGATFTGPPSSMYRFLENLNTMSRVVTIESISLQQAGGAYNGSMVMRFYALGA